MYIKSLIPAIILAGQVLNVAALPATTITLHSTVASTTMVAAETDAAGSNLSNATTPARFSPSTENTSLPTLSSFSDAAIEQGTKATFTVTETQTQGIPYPVLITVTEYYCPHSTAEVVSSSSAVSSERTSVSVSSTAAPASSSTNPSSETKSTPAPATTTKACVFPIPGECDI